MQRLRHFYFGLSLFASALVGLGAIVVGCSNKGSSSIAVSNAVRTTAKVSVKLSDPATCMAPTGPFLHVYVTIADLRAHANANAGTNDAGWEDLTPSLATAPVTVDLLGLADNQCFLATMGDAQELQAGSYQQLRIILADAVGSSSGGKGGSGSGCGDLANCVVLNDGSVHPLLLSSETQTGIKITFGQIANGGFDVAGGEAKDLDIDFDTCASIVQEGNGQFRLKPVLHAGEVAATASTINGTVVNAAGAAIGGTVEVTLQQKDTTGVDRVFMSTLTKADGSFVFCPLPMGTYDMVVVGLGADGTVYSPTVITGVTTGDSVPGVTLTANPAVIRNVAQLQGQVTAQNGAMPAMGAVTHLELSALETVATNLTVTVPMVPNVGYSNVTLVRATSQATSCAAGTDCMSYSMSLPAGQPMLAAYAATGLVFSSSGAPVSYVVDARASVPSSGGLPDCAVSELESAPVTGRGGTVSTLTFTGCQ